MSDSVQVALITGGCIVLASAVPAWFAYQAHKTAQATHHAVNSRRDEFVEMAKKSFRAEGVAQEQADERQRQAATKKDQT